MLPGKVQFGFVYAKYVSCYMLDISHFATMKWPPPNQSKHSPLVKNYKSYTNVESTAWKNSSKK